MATNEQISKEIGVLKDLFDKFLEQYEEDMRGDKNMENGNRGVIGNIREIKKYIKEYPSLTYLFFKYPFRVIGVGIGIYLILMTLYSLGLLKIVGSAIGVNLP